LQVKSERKASGALKKAKRYVRGADQQRLAQTAMHMPEKEP
jgi:hypothetical protein